MDMFLFTTSSLQWRVADESYLILVLLRSVHLGWGVGEVLGAFVELVLHGVNGVAAATQATGNCFMQVFHQVSSLFVIILFSDQGSVKKKIILSEKCYFVLDVYFISCDASRLHFMF